MLSFGSVRSLVALLSIISHVNGGTLKYYNCGSKSSPVTVHGVSLDPDPAISGQNMTFTIPATANVPISGGSVLVIVQFYGIPVYFEKDELCTKTTKCPINSNEGFTFTNSQVLPDVSPAGPYTVRIDVRDDSFTQLFCERMTFKIEKPVSKAKSFMGNMFQNVKSLFDSHHSQVGEVLDAADKAWKLTAETKLKLKKMLMEGKAFSEASSSYSNGEEGVSFL